MEFYHRAAIFGVTGFIGRGVPRLLAAQGVASTGFSRRGAGRVEGVSAWRGTEAIDLAGHSMVVNLAGESIASRWTAARRRRFHESRVGLTQRVVEEIRALPPAERPQVLVNGSAVGIYGDRGDEELTEDSALGQGYLADLCREWEAAALEAESLGVRVVLLRTGIVLGRGGEAFERLLRVFRCGIGGRLGSGRQWMPWVHVDDLRRLIVHALLTESLRGPLLGVAPFPERNADFTRKLATALHRPAILPVPGIALKLALGGFGGALLQGQRTKAPRAEGFAFAHPTLEQALEDLIKGPPSPP